MWPVRPLGLRPEQILIFLGFLAAIWIVRRRIPRDRVPTQDLLDVAIAGLLGGILGSILFFEAPLRIRGSAGSETVSTGSAFFGGLLGGYLGGALFLRWKRIPFALIADATSSAIPFAFVLGKIGCFLDGCCYGIRGDGFPCMTFAPGSLAHAAQIREGVLPRGAAASLPVHPTQLYEAAFGLALFAALTILHRRSRRPGETTCAFFALYSAWRFGIEFLRGDPGRHAFGAAGLSDSQIAALVIAPLAAMAWILVRRRSRIEEVS